MNMRKLLLLIGFLYGISLQAQEQFVVFFDSGKFETNPKESQKLQQWIQTHKEVKILAIQGYTDEDGSSGYNDTLSRKRVDFIFKQVQGKVATREDYKAHSFGENFTQSKNKAENRRATILYIEPKDFARENEILGIKPVEPEKPTEPQVIEEEAMNFPENATLEQKIQLARVGTLIRLKDINFYVNTFAVMPSSKNSVDQLVNVLYNNPKLCIEIQGHICCVSKDYKNLSLDRARQIKRILVSEGINPERISVKGFGVSKPKFPIPEKSEAEAAQNRRVEILITQK
ncbi:MAG: hypothetical protein RL607_2304 [Bacteroidota bacterium]